MGLETYQMKPLVGEKNYNVWKEEVKGLLGLDELWDIVKEEELRPLNAPPRPEDSPSKIEDGVTTPAIVVTQSTIERWEDKLEAFEEKQKKWDKRRVKVATKIYLNCGTGPRVHIEGLEDLKEMWDVLEKHYKATSLATRDLAFLQLHASQSDFKSIQEYAEHLKKAHSQLIQLGHKLPDLVLSTSFRLGLKPDLEPYIVSLVEAARANMRELDVDEMMMA